MTRRRRTHLLTMGLTACLIVPAVASPQSEKVSVRMAPQPGQSVRMAMTQEMDFDIAFDGPATPPGLTSMKMQMRATMSLTQKTGPIKADGSVEAELTYDEFRTEISMNGQPMSADSGNQIVGKPVTVTYARDGQILSVKGLPPGGLTDEAFKEMMGSMLGNLPMTPIGVGETATAPLDFNVPLPLPGVGPMKMSGATTIRLVSIDKDAQGRSARFDSSVNGTISGDFPSPDGKGTLTLKFALGGDGTTVLDLDKGLPRSATSTTTMNGTMALPVTAAPNAALPPMTMRGTVKVTITGN